jgi:2-phospho-L-lactate guanylyltransferase (CobY/MobA/RfbA family)
MRRLVAVAATASLEPLALAMLEDVVDLVTQMQQVEPALALPPDAGPEVAAVTWPGTLTVEVPPGEVVSVLDALAAAGADEAAIVAADVPDLPPLLLGKLHSALTSAEVAVCPAYDGTLVAVASRLPVPAWLRDLAPSLDDRSALGRLRAAAPRRALHVGPGWHRVRGHADLARLDPGLEGWEATRALLGG